MNIAIIIPTYNEKKNITLLIPEIFSYKIPNLNIYVVDDNSPDGTAEIVNDYANNWPSLKLIKRRYKSGLGSAYVVGFKKALADGADIILEMDADFSHNPEDLIRLVDKIKENYDVVIGSRRINGGKIENWDFIRHFLSWSVTSLAKNVLHLKTKDVASGFRCYRKEIFSQVDLDKIRANGYAFQEEIIYLCEKNNFKIAEIPIIFKNRQIGTSKWSLFDAYEFFKILIALKFNN